MENVSKNLRVALNEYPILEYGNSSKRKEVIAFEHRSCENDIVTLPLALLAANVR